MVDVERSKGLHAGIAYGYGQEFGVGGILNEEESVFALLPNDGGGFGEVADPNGGMWGMWRCGGEGGFVDAATEAVGGIEDLGDGVVGAVLNLLDAADGFGADEVAGGIVNDHAVGVEHEHGVSDGEFVEGDVSGRYEVFGEQGFVASAIDLKDFATALVGDEVAVVDGVIGRCVGGVEIVLCIGLGRSEQEAN